MAPIDGYVPAEESGRVEEHDDEETQDEDEKAEILRDVVPELIREENDSIYKALEAHYGGAVGLFVSLWNSRQPLHRIDPHEDFVNSRLPPDAAWTTCSPRLSWERWRWSSNTWRAVCGTGSWIRPAEVET